MVVVVPQHLDDAGRAVQACVRANEDAAGTSVEEEIDERLGKAPVYLPRAERSPLAAITARIVDVDVEPVLVRDMARPEGATVRTAQVSDAETRGAWVSGSVAVDDGEHRTNEPVRAPPTGAAVRSPVEQRIPREEESALGWQLDAAQQPALGGTAQRPG